MRTSEGKGRYRVLLFDVDGTLLDFQAAERESIRQVLKAAGLAPTEELLQRYHRVNEHLWSTFERGEITKEALLESRFQIFFETLGVSTDGRAEESLYRRCLGASAIPMKDALEVCRRLRKNHRMYIVTNGVSETQYSRLAASGLDVLFDDVFVSEDAKSQKPQQAFFEYCFSRMPREDRERSRMLLIGDSIRSDMKGANGAGIDACWYNPQGQERVPGVQIDWEIRELQELLQLEKP